MISEQPRFLDILAFGEALIDLISDQVASSLTDADGFHRFVGGEVTNVVLNVTRLGGRAALVACVGNFIGIRTMTRHQNSNLTDPTPWL